MRKKLPTLKLSADEEYLLDGSVRLYQNDTDLPMEVRFFRIVPGLMPATIDPVYHMRLNPHHRTGVSRMALKDSEHYLILAIGLHPITTRTLLNV